MPGSGDDAVIDFASATPFTVAQDFTGTIAGLAMGNPDPNYADATLAFAGTAQLARSRMTAPSRASGRSTERFPAAAMSKRPTASGPERHRRAEPNFRVLAENNIICPSERTADRYAFVLPAGTRRITLLSRATRPADIHRYLDDRRSLGIAVASVTLRTGQSFDVFPPDHLPAAGGWHAAETADGHRWRWTNGAGVLEFDPLPTAAILDIRLGGAAAYAVEEPASRLSA